MTEKLNHKPVSNLSFQWDIINFDSRNQEYTIRNRVTMEERTMAKDRLLELMEEQGKGVAT